MYTVFIQMALALYANSGCPFYETCISVGPKNGTTVIKAHIWVMIG